MQEPRNPGEKAPNRVEKAAELFQEAYRAQVQGDLSNAMRLYQESIQMHPTAEA